MKPLNLKETALKEEIKEILEELENMYEISELEEQVNNINKIRDYIINLQQERDLYKEVIEELREYIEDWLFDAGGNGASMTYEDINELLQILDKVIGDDK